jgi:hypothetical protein
VQAAASGDSHTVDVSVNATLSLVASSGEAGVQGVVLLTFVDAFTAVSASGE